MEPPEARETPAVERAFRLGAIASGGARRGLLQFDLTAVPPGSTVTSVSLRITGSKAAAASGADLATLHRGLAGWGVARYSLPWILSLAASVSFAGEHLYYFVDERGIPHFSNVPHDARYKPFAGEIALGASLAAETADGLRLVLTGPMSAARRGQLIEVSVTLPGSQNMRGLAEVHFDPAALVFHEASTDAYLAGPGRLRLELEPGIASVFAAAVQFKVVPGARGQTTLNAAVVDLEDEERRAVAVRPAEPLVVSFAP